MVVVEPSFFFFKKKKKLISLLTHREPSPIKKSNKSPNEPCSHCKVPVDTTNKDSYKTYRDEIYCCKDFTTLFLPKCRSCYQPVEKEAISAMDGKLDGKWHIDCFCCQVIEFNFKQFFQN
jgi:hypothetical protein